MNLSSHIGAEIGAGRIMLVAIRNALTKKESFGFETTLSANLWVSYINKAKRLGYSFTLSYVAVRDVSICLERIAERVRLGGHAVPDDIVRRRFLRSSRLFVSSYKNLADRWYVFDNSGEHARLIAEKDSSGERIIDAATYQEIFTNVR